MALAVLLPDGLVFGAKPPQHEHELDRPGELDATLRKAKKLLAEVLLVLRGGQGGLEVGLLEHGEEITSHVEETSAPELVLGSASLRNPLPVNGPP